MCEEGMILCSTSSTPPGMGEEAAGAAPSDVPEWKGSTGTPGPARDFFRGKKSQFLRTQQHFQPCCSISGQARPAVGTAGHQAETWSPGMSHLLHPQQRQMLQHKPCTRYGSNLCCSSPHSSREAYFSLFFSKRTVLCHHVRDGGTLLSSSSSGQSFRWKTEQDMALQSQGSPSPAFATLSQPQLLQELLPLLLQKGNSLSNQPCSPSNAQRLQLPPRGFRPYWKAPSSIPTGSCPSWSPGFTPHPRASHIPGFTPHIKGIPQCLHAEAVPHRRFVFMASPSPY